MKKLIDQLCVRRAILPTSKMFRIDGGIVDQLKKEGASHEKWPWVGYRW